MKKVLILALFAMPLCAFAQGKTPAAETKKESKQMEAVKEPQVIYMELQITESTAGGTSMRFDVGKEQMSGISDKEFVAKLAEMRSMAVSNVPDAMTYLAANGFRFMSSYSVNLKDRSETHLVFEREMVRRKERPETPETPSKPVSKTPTLSTVPAKK